MKERGKKAVEMYGNEEEEKEGQGHLFQPDYSVPSDLPCKKHPSASSVGICAQCLKDRLVNLVCSECGEQRLSSCSCSEMSSSSNRNSCTVEVGSVGRISFLLENDQRSNNNEVSSHSNGTIKSKINRERIDHDGRDVFLLNRSSSSCVEIKKKSGFWRIGKLFSKKRGKGNCERSSSVGGFEEKSDLWLVDYMGVSRSRSLCSFRGGGGYFGSEDGTFSGARSSISAARSSISAARSSGVNGGLLFDPDRKSGFSEGDPRKSGFNGCLPFDPDRKSGFSEGEPRKSGFDSEKKGNIAATTTTTALNPEKFDTGLTGAKARRVFSLKEGNFTSVDDSGFIDLKFDFPSESNKVGGDHHSTALKMMGSGFSDANSSFKCIRGGAAYSVAHQYHDQCGSGTYGYGGLVGDGGVLTKGGSCRFTFNDHTQRGIKGCRKSFKSWRWIFSQRGSDPGSKKNNVL